MFVLSRGIGEQIVAVVDGKEVIITIVSIRGNTVRLGVTAPPGLPIRRREKDENLSGA